MAHHLANQLPDVDKLESPDLAAAQGKASGAQKQPKPEDLVHLYNGLLQVSGDYLLPFWSGSFFPFQHDKNIIHEEVEERFLLYCLLL